MNSKLTNTWNSLFCVVRPSSGCCCCRCITSTHNSQSNRVMFVMHSTMKCVLNERTNVWWWTVNGQQRQKDGETFPWKFIHINRVGNLIFTSIVFRFINNMETNSNYMSSHGIHRHRRTQPSRTAIIIIEGNNKCRPSTKITITFHLLRTANNASINLIYFPIFPRYGIFQAAYGLTVRLSHSRPVRRKPMIAVNVEDARRCHSINTPTLRHLFE